MAIRIKPDGTVEADSTDEAMEMYRRLAQERDSTEDSEEEKEEDESEDETTARTVTLGANAKKMLSLLLPLEPDTGKTTEELATALGVNGPKGLASITRQIRAWGRQQFGLDDEDCVERFETKDGTSCLLIPSRLRHKIKGREKELLE